jgi:hypothetical protein
LGTYQRIHNRASMGFRRRMGIKTRSRLRRAGGMIATKRRKFGKKSTTSGRGVTFEHDRQFIYGHKKMPSRKKRRWVRFKRKVNAISEKELGTRTVLMNTGITETNTTPNNQGLANFSLYSLGGAASYMSDLQYIGDLENNANPTAADGNRVADNGKIMFQSAVLDLTMRNISFISGQGDLNTECTLETDIYEITVKRLAYLGTGDFDDLKDMFDSNNTAGIYNQATLATGTPIVLTQRGCTPFEKVKAIKQYGVKIWRKTKYFLKPGQTLTYQVRDPKRHVAYKNRILKPNMGFNKPGWSKHILIVFKAVPGIVVGSTTGETTEALSIGVTRKYMYKVEGVQEDRSIRLLR